MVPCADHIPAQIEKNMVISAKRDAAVIFISGH